MRCAPLRKEKRLRFFGGAFPWDGMGGNIGGYRSLFLALMIQYYKPMSLQWMKSEIPVTKKLGIHE